MIETKFKETEVGLVPVDWEVKRLGKLCSINGRIGFRGYTKADLVKKHQGAITYSPSDITDQILDNSHCDYISLQKYEESPEIKVFNGDILFCKTASIGKCAIVKNLNEKATINPQFVVLKDFKCNNDFLYNILAFSNFQERVKSITGGSTIPTMSQEKLKEQIIPLPPLPEQRRIATTLSNIDSLISNLDTLIEKKRNIKQGAMQQLLTGKKRLDGFNELWVEKKFEEVFEVLNTRSFQLNTSEYCTIGKIKIIDQGKEAIAGYSNRRNPFACPPDGVIIFGDHTRIFKISKEDFFVGADGVQVLHCVSNDTTFLYYYCLTLDIPNTGYNRHFKYLKESAFRLPSTLSEQRAIASILTSMDDEIAKLEQKREKYAAVKQGMMQQLLTGKIRLTD